MDKRDMDINELAAQQFIKVDYSDDDVIIVDNVRQLVDPNPTRLRMNLISTAKRGKAQLTVGGQRITLGPNQLLLCPAGSVFTDFMFSPDFEFKAVFLTSRIIQSFLREKMSIWNEVLYVYRTKVVTLNEREAEFIFQFYNTLRLCIDAPADHYLYRSECIQSLLRCAVLGLCDILKNRIPAHPVKSRTMGDTLFQRFLDLLSRGALKTQTVESYASELCVSPKYLTVVCKKATGKTAGEWIREHMLEEIRYYLKQTDLSMKQISDRLGFANPSFFGRYVKEHFGMTPGQFRAK